MAYMYRILFLAIGLLIATSSSHASDCVSELRMKDAPISIVGAFSNVRSTDEHAYGYTVELWKSGDCLFGLLLVYKGLDGDTPTGMLDQLKYEPHTGAISFQARLTTGSVSSSPTSNVYVPSRDLYKFSGVLDKNRLRGTMRHVNLVWPDVPEKKQSVTLKPYRQRLEQMKSSPARFRQWERETKELLKGVRGPKW